MAQVLNKSQTISNLREEVNLLRSFVIGIVGKDKEGEYKPEFVKKTLRALRKEPKHTFKNKNSFLTKSNS